MFGQPNGICVDLHSGVLKQRLADRKLQARLVCRSRIVGFEQWSGQTHRAAGDQRHVETGRIGLQSRPVSRHVIARISGIGHKGRFEFGALGVHRLAGNGRIDQFDL